MRDRWDVLGVGIVAFDLVFDIPRFPEPDEKVEAHRVRGQGGGLTGTALVAVARLGGSAAWLGDIGDDALGRFCMEEFRREGVDVSQAREVPGASVTTAAVLSDSATGTRAILWSRDAAPHTAPGRVTPEMVGAARVLHVDGLSLPVGVRAARIARELGVPVVVDEEQGDRAADELLALASCAILPVACTQARYGTDDPREGARAAYDEFAPAGLRVAVVTAGTAGAFGVDDGDEFHQPAYRAPAVVDTTGCGDVYHGAFELGLAWGWPVRRCAQVAAATAALKCRAPGGRAGIPSMAEVDAFLKTAEPIGE